MQIPTGALRRSALAEALRESLVTACVLGLVVGLLLGVWLGAVEGPGLVDLEPPDQLTLVVSLLTAVMTVVGVVLSILALNQQLASSQYSPRAIRTTLRDRPTRVALGVLFGYLGAMLGVVEGIGEAPPPPLGVVLSPLLTLIALGVVVYVIQHVTDGFRAGRLVRRIGDDTIAAVERIARRDDVDQQEQSRALGLDDVPDDALRIHAQRSGYLQDVAVDELSGALADAGLHVRLGIGVGDFVGARTGIGYAWAAEGSDEPDHGEVEALVDRHCRFGATRTTEREVSSGVQQLVDIAIKALSPAVNDPYTAVQATHVLTDVCQRMAERRQDWLVGVVDDQLVLTVPRPLVWDLVDHTISSIRRVAGGYPEVLDALVLLLRTMAATRPREADRIEAHLDAILEEASTADLLPRDVAVVVDLVAWTREERAHHEEDAVPRTDEETPDEAAPDDGPDDGHGDAAGEADAAADRAGSDIR